MIQPNMATMLSFMRLMHPYQNHLLIKHLNIALSFLSIAFQWMEICRRMIP